jgi:hypothetical protein
LSVGRSLRIAYEKYSAAVNMLNRGQSPVLECCHHPRGFQEDALEPKNSC